MDIGTHEAIKTAKLLKTLFKNRKDADYCLHLNISKNRCVFHHNDAQKIVYNYTGN